MIYGIGNDILEIKRIEKAILKENFLSKICTEREIENIKNRGNRAETYAAIFSVKEAISKAIGTGVRNFSLIDIEILNDDLGKPYVCVSAKLDKLILERLGQYKIEISISHSEKYVSTVAIIFKKN